MAEKANQSDNEELSSSVYYNQDHGDDDYDNDNQAAAAADNECDSFINNNNNNNNNDDKLTQQVPQAAPSWVQIRKRKFESESDSSSSSVHVASTLSDNITKIFEQNKSKSFDHVIALIKNTADISKGPNYKCKDAEKKEEVVTTSTSIAKEEQPSRRRRRASNSHSNGASEVEEESSKKFYKCKVCGNAFNSHQALGGHTAGHNMKKRLTIKQDNVIVTEKQGGGGGDGGVHACNQCLRTFPTGQALGGHKSFHRFQAAKQAFTNDSQLRNYQLHSNNTSFRLFGVDLSSSTRD